MAVVLLVQARSLAWSQVPCAIQWLQPEPTAGLIPIRRVLCCARPGHCLEQKGSRAWHPNRNRPIIQLTQEPKPRRESGGEEERGCAWRTGPFLSRTPPVSTSDPVKSLSRCRRTEIRTPFGYFPRSQKIYWSLRLGFCGVV